MYAYEREILAVFQDAETFFSDFLTRMTTAWGRYDVLPWGTPLGEYVAICDLMCPLRTRDVMSSWITGFNSAKKSETN